MWTFCERLRKELVHDPGKIWSSNLPTLSIEGLMIIASGVSVECYARKLGCSTILYSYPVNHIYTVSYRMNYFIKIRKYWGWRDSSVIWSV